MRPLLPLLLTAALAACHYVAPAIPVTGNSGDVAALAGEWRGEYSGIDSDRRGSITFSLRAGADSAYGDVLMVAQQGNRMMGYPMDTPREHMLHAQSAQSLAIRFVRVRSGALSGTLEPYLAPDCDCLVTTVFSGHVSGNVASGTFVTRSEVGWTQRGIWRAERY
jgi:hypothetical protein